MSTKNNFPDILLGDPFATTPQVKCEGNQMSINGHVFEVTEKYKRLVICLLNDITKKNDIINVVWYEKAGMVSDNNYHQLLHKFRKLLTDNNLPKEMLRTVPRYGAVLNLSCLPTETEKNNYAKQSDTLSYPAKKTSCLRYLVTLLGSGIAAVTKSIQR